MEDGLVPYLSADAGLTALIGDRLYPEDAETGAGFPRVVYAVLASRYDETLTGPSGLASATLALTAMGDSKADVLAVVKAMERLFEDAVLPAMWGPYRVTRATIQDKVSDKEAPKDGSGGWVYWTTLAVSVLYARF